MAAEKRKFVIPSVEELEEKNTASCSSSPPLKVFKTSVASFKSMRKDSDTETRKRLLKALSSHTSSSSDQNPGNIMRTDSRTISETAEADFSATSTTMDSRSTSASSNNEPLSAGKSFKDTFAFLKNTKHYEEADAKMKEIE